MDLWAEWCEPCKQLSPVLEKLAAEADGAWVLAKVDVDANPQLSAALQVQSIPMVVAVVGGQLVPGFLGALPEAQVRQWLGQLMQVAQQLGMPSAADAGGDQAGEAGPGEGPQAPEGMAGGPDYRDPGLAEAQEAMERGDLDGAAAAFERMLEADSGHPIAAQGLAQVNLFRRVNSYDEAAARRAAAGRPDDVDAQSKVADLDLANGRVDDAFDRMLGLIRRTSGEDRDQARRHLIGLFDIFPPRDPGSPGAVRPFHPALLTRAAPAVAAGRGRAGSQRRRGCGQPAPCGPAAGQPGPGRADVSRGGPGRSARPGVAWVRVGELFQRGQGRRERGHLLAGERAEAVSEHGRALLTDPLQDGPARRGDGQRAGPRIPRDRAAVDVAALLQRGDQPGQGGWCDPLGGGEVAEP
jgi:putative thioredoxin